MPPLTLLDAKDRLPELFSAACAGETVEIARDDGWTIRMIAVPPHPTRVRPPATGVPKAGRWEGQVVVPDDFKAPLEDLREYME